MHGIWNISHVDIELLITAYKRIASHKYSTKHTEGSYSAII